MTLRMRSKVFWAFLALPFQMRQCSRSTSVTIVALASLRPGSSAGNPLAANFACCSRMGDVEPVRDRRCGDAGVGKNRSQAGTAIGERSHLCGSGSAGCLEALTDLNCNVEVSDPGDGAEDLPPTVGCLVDVANAELPDAGYLSRS